jgi:hypothetical protein
MSIIEPGAELRSKVVVGKRDLAVESRPIGEHDE